MVVFILIAFVAICVSIDALVQFRKSKGTKVAVLSTIIQRTFNEKSISIPKGLYFDKTHTWAFMEKNGWVKLGIDDFLLHVTGPVNRLKMKKTGDKIIKGEALITIIQNGKQLTLYSPISGSIKSINNVLSNDAGLINSSPYNEGWLYEIEPMNWLRDVQFLFMQEKYMEWIKKEFSRLKDFFAVELKSSEVVLIPVMMQDGGELKDNVLADFGPEVWEDFQIKYLNSVS
jgi:glycine cleavage system H lipoate-binding protein